MKKYALIVTDHFSFGRFCCFKKQFKTGFCLTRKYASDMRFVDEKQKRNVKQHGEGVSQTPIVYLPV